MTIPYARFKYAAAVAPLVRFVNFVVMLLALTVCMEAFADCIPMSMLSFPYGSHHSYSACQAGSLAGTAVILFILALPNALAYWGMGRSSPVIISRLGLILCTLPLIPVGAFIFVGLVGIAKGDGMLPRDIVLFGFVSILYLPNVVMLRDRLARIAEPQSGTSDRPPAVFGIGIAGRVGRLRYLACFLPPLLLLPFVLLLAFIFGSSDPVAMVVFASPLLALNAWLLIRPVILRFHDLDHGGMWPAFIVALAGSAWVAHVHGGSIFYASLFALYMIALASVMGTKGANRFGARLGKGASIQSAGSLLGEMVKT